MKPGYKQTDVGVIPENWDVAQIGGVAQIHVGRDLREDCFSRDFHSAYPYPVYSNTVAEHGLYGFYSIPEYEGESITVVGRGVGLGTAFARTGGYGAIGRLLVLFPNACADARFLATFINERLSIFVETGGIPQLTGIQFSKYKVALPPLPEQRAIAEALSDVDALLGALDRLIAKKRDLKQAAMQQLLTGQTRLPGFVPAKVSFRQTQVGVIPEDWELAPLVDLVDPSRGIRYGIVQPGNYDPHGRYMIRGQDYSEVKGWANPTDVFRVSPGVEERYRNSRVKTGDLIMTIVGYCGHVEMTPDWLDGANLTQTTARIAIQPDKAVSAFCKYVLLSPTGRNQVAAYMKGAAQPGLNCGDVEKFLITVPPLPEQTAIAEVLSDMDADLAALEQRRDKTRALKQGMMQELLTGRIRLCL